MPKNSLVNIIHITSSLDNLTETFIQGFVKEIDLLDQINLNVFTLDKPKLSKSLRNPVIHLKIPKFTNFKSKIREYSNAKITQKKRLAEFGISDIVYDSAKCVFIDFSVNFLNVFSTVEKFEKPVFVFLHGYDASKVFRNVEFRNKFQFLGGKNNVFFVSPCNYFLNKIKVNFGFNSNNLLKLPYGVNFQQQARNIHSSSPEMFTLLFVGRFVPKKNPLALIEMLNYLIKTKNLKNIRLVLIGIGPLMYRTLERVRKYGLEEYVIFKGALPHQKVLEEFQQATIYVQHSVTDFEGDQEGLPNSILEALVSGIPVVSTIHSGIPEVVVDGYNGYLVQEFDYCSMAERICDLLTNKSLYEGVVRNVIKTKAETLWTNKQRAESILRQILGDV